MLNRICDNGSPHLKPRCNISPLLEGMYKKGRKYQASAACERVQALPRRYWEEIAVCHVIVKAWAIVGADPLQAIVLDPRS